MAQPIQLKQEKKSVLLKIGDNKLTVHKGDITNLKADAIVCPVNQNLDTHTGVADVIIKAAGPTLRAHKPVIPEPYGKVVVLPGGKLKTKYVFMTVLLGEKGLEKIRLSISQAVDRTIRYAEFLRIKTLAFPVLGSPDVHPPYEFIAKEMLMDVTRYFKRRNTKIKAVLFSVYNPKAYEAFCKEAHNLVDL